MKITTQESQAEQVRRLAAKTQDQRMVNEVVCGTGMSPWEAQIILEVIREKKILTEAQIKDLLDPKKLTNLDPSIYPQP